VRKYLLGYLRGLRKFVTASLSYKVKGEKKEVEKMGWKSSDDIRMAVILGRSGPESKVRNLNP
jgi:hypothetical protein